MPGIVLSHSDTSTQKVQGMPDLQVISQQTTSSIPCVQVTLRKTTRLPVATERKPLGKKWYLFSRFRLRRIKIRKGSLGGLVRKRLIGSCAPTTSLPISHPTPAVTHTTSSCKSPCPPKLPKCFTSAVYTGNFASKIFTCNNKDFLEK